MVYYNDPNELAERMKILVGSMAAGNNSPVIKNDLAMINDEFLRIGAIDQTTHEKIYKKYLKLNVDRALVFKSIDAKNKIHKTGQESLL